MKIQIFSLFMKSNLTYLINFINNKNNYKLILAVDFSV